MDLFPWPFFLMDLFSVGHFSVDVFSVNVISVDLFSYNPSLGLYKLYLQRSDYLSVSCTIIEINETEIAQTYVTFPPLQFCVAFSFSCIFSRSVGLV